MDTLTIKIPEGKTSYIARIVKEAGGEVIENQKNDAESEEDEVIHGEFFGEILSALLRLFQNINVCRRT